jgi:hypothetical protein
MKIIGTILRSKFFQDQPPVLVDIGASGEINSKWDVIASYSICLAFDADDRDFQFSENVNGVYKKLITFNRIVTAEPLAETNFYLTSSPYCSSVLKPENEKLKPWVFKDFFRVEKMAVLPAITVAQALQQAGIQYVDWFKSDSQGTDLRLFKSLPGEIASKVLAAEFEPGIIDAYEGEDMLSAIIWEMHNDNFWMSSMEIKGTQRLHAEYAQTMNSFVRRRVLRNSPCWAEITYLRQKFPDNERQLLLLYVFALVEKQFGFALEIADYAITQFKEPLFEECRKAVLKKLETEKLKTPLVFFKKQFNKFFSAIHD